MVKTQSWLASRSGIKERKEVRAMAKNTGSGHRVGAVKGRTQVQTPSGWTKRGPEGKFMDVKADGKPFKGVTKEK
jgi:hypothetical protein